MPTSARTVRVVLFATAREAVGRPAVDCVVPPEGLSVAELLRRLGSEYPRLRATLRSSRFVRNGRYISGRTGRIRPGDEFAVHPPYGGG